MDFVGRVAKGFKSFYNEINPATLTGAYNIN
jgi:phosphatidate phosphatase PAH1